MKEKIKTWIFSHIGGRVYLSDGENEKPITGFISAWKFKKLIEEALNKSNTVYDFSAALKEVLEKNGYIKEER